MAYSIDVAYLDYFKNAAVGLHDSTPIRDRLKATGFAAGTAFIGLFRIAIRVVKLLIEIAKVIFYSLASLFTGGAYRNANRLKDHFKLLTLNAAALVGLPLQMIIHSLAMIVGIISPKAAYRTMQIGTSFLAWITSHENEIWQHYKTPKCYTKVTEALASKITSILNHYPLVMQLVLKTILNEFSYAFDAALVAPIGYTEQFHSFGANPKSLTDEQKKLTPILLLNGNYSHQGTFLPLLYALKLTNNQRPVYSIHLPANMTHPSYIAAKIMVIKSQYGNSNHELFEIDMIGHSMGANLIQNICYASKDEHIVQIRRAITVGTPFIISHTIANQAKVSFDIIGTEDCLVTRKSVLSQEHQIEIKTGHLGLLFHHKSLNTMIRLLAYTGSIPIWADSKPHGL